MPTGSENNEILARRSQPVITTKAHSGNKPMGRLQQLISDEHFRPRVHDELKSETSAVSIENFSLWYGKKQALFNINLDVPKGKVTALIGPSGCGKSTLLRSVNRMNDLNPAVQTRGDIRIGPQSIFDRSISVTDLRKRLGMVFQKPNPFPAVFSTISFTHYASKVFATNRCSVKFANKACGQPRYGTKSKIDSMKVDWGCREGNNNVFASLAP